eukprot:Rmarinus@m.12620
MVRAADHSCCGCSLQTGVRIMTAATFVWCIWDMIFLFQTPTVLLGSGIIGLVGVFCSVAGFWGAQSQNVMYLRVYYYYILLCILWQVVFFITALSTLDEWCRHDGAHTSAGDHQKGCVAMTIMSTLFWLPMLSYFAYLVWSLAEQISGGGSQNVAMDSATGWLEMPMA